ncbi:hypothetical protein C2W62_06545 [Candidatus Entotheonella serta]|nr:hypothetical protein C2W62_06545 [Candidatus Entotheonella serta]
MMELRELTLPAQRAAFLAAVCGADESLLHAVEALLRADEKAANLLEKPVAALAGQALAQAQVGIQPTPQAGTMAGRELGPYKILTLLGAGGMGEVYLAQDSRLGRKVALKLLPERFTSDAERLRRFEQEGRVASALNHPNIITIHEIGQTPSAMGGAYYIVTEFIEGRTLRQQLTNGRMNLLETVEIALQAASALDAAHTAGIVHRDIKPENIMVRPDGYVKVLDFGLAKLTEQPPDEAEGSASASLTQPGRVLGTLRYMSPEQARGLKVDARTDIFSLGIVLYEMVTGQSPFAGATTADVIAAVLQRELPPLAHYAPAVPPALERIVNQMLVKDRDARYQAARELLLDLKNLRHERGNEAQPRQVSEADKYEAEAALLPQLAPAPNRRAQGWKRLTGYTVLGLVTVAAGLYLWFNRAGRVTTNSPATSRMIAKIVPFTGLAGRENDPAFAPKGKQLAFSWQPEGSDNFDIYVKLIGAGDPLRLTKNPATDAFPAWSPDGRYIAWVRQYSTFNEIYVIPALGGVERRIYRTQHAVWSSLAWTPDGQQIAIADGQNQAGEPGIFLISLATGAAQRVTTSPPGTRDMSPAFAPPLASAPASVPASVLGTEIPALAFRRVFSASSLMELFVLDTPGRQPRQLTAEQAFIAGFTWMPDGRELLYSVTRNDSASLRIIRRDAQPQAGQAQAFGAAGRKAFFPAIAPDGRQIAFVEPLEVINIWQLTPDGKGRKLITSNYADHSPQIAPNGQHIVFVSTRSGGEEVWRCRANGSQSEQLTQRNAPTGSPRWSPDGRWLVFDSREDGNSELFVSRAEGGPPRRLTNDKADDRLPCWSPDGQTIYFRSNRSGSHQLWKMPVQGGPAVQLTQHGAFESFAAPDGKFVYYSKGRGIAGLWRVGTAGTSEQAVPELADAGYWRAWLTTPQGLYYVAKTDSLPLPLKLFDFTTQQSRIVATTAHAPAWLPHSLGVSADGRQILHAQSDLFSSSIMLMENFR